jgi:hypothetical protein
VQGGVALIASTASVQGKGQSKSSASLAIKALRTHLGIPTLSHRSSGREKSAKRPDNDTNHVLLVAPFPDSAPRLFCRLSQRDPFLQLRREARKRLKGRNVFSRYSSTKDVSYLSPGREIAKLPSCSTCPCIDTPFGAARHRTALPPR